MLPWIWSLVFVRSKGYVANSATQAAITDSTYFVPSLLKPFKLSSFSAISLLKV